MFLGQHRWWTRQPFWYAGSNQPRAAALAAVHLSLKGLDGGKCLQKLKCLPDPLRLIWKCCVSGWELICSWVADINLDRAGVVKIVNFFFFVESGSQAQPEAAAARPPEKERTHAVSDICAVVHMVLVKCVWMPTPSYATKSRDVLESCLGALQCCCCCCFFIILILF